MKTAGGDGDTTTVHPDAHLADITFRSGSDTSNLQTALNQLQQAGGALLLTGDVDPSVYQTAIRELMETEIPDPAYSLVMLHNNDAEEWLPATTGQTGAQTRVLERPLARGAVAAPAGCRPSASYSEVDDDVLAAVGAHIEDSIEAMRPSRALGDDSDTAVPYPEERLRVALVSLAPLVEQHGLERILDWLGREAGGILDVVRRRRNRGRMHVTYPVANDADVVDELMADPGLFDLHIELRTTKPRPEWRWTLPANRFHGLHKDEETHWFPVTY